MYVKVHRRKTRIRRQEQFQVVLYGDNNEPVLDGEKLHNKADAVAIANKVAASHGQWVVNVDG